MDRVSFATANLTRTQSGSENPQDGTFVHLGGGVMLSAGHVMFQFVNPDTVRSAEAYGIHVATGLDSPSSVSILDADFTDTFYSLGWGTSGGSDMSVAFTDYAGTDTQPLLVYADPNEAEGTLTSFGYPVAGGFDGQTMVQVTGNLTTNSHTDVPTSNGNMSVLVSDIGMQVFSGQSGSGVWITNDVDGDGLQETYLAGIVSLDVQFVGDLHATGFEPMADVHSQLGTLIDEHGLTGNDFARATLVSGQSLGSAFTTVDGTGLNEDLIGGQNADTLDGGGGDDSLIGAAGDDVLTDGAGKDVFTGGTGADTFVMSIDGRAEKIMDFDLVNDQIDVSAWGVTQLSDMTLSDHISGRVILRYGSEAIVIDDGSRGLDASDFTAGHFVFRQGGDPLNVIQGTSGRDKLIGTLADDEIHDLGGFDNMFGRGGADVFVLSADGETDAIKDFEQGADRIDVSAWGATGLGDLTLSDHGSGKIFVTFNDELLQLSDTGRTLDAADLTAADFIFA